MFTNLESNERHSLTILEGLQEYDDFMESIATLVDLGCGAGEDLAWWATRATREDSPKPLNIQCVGVDLAEALPVAHQHKNMTYQQVNFEDKINAPEKKFDVLWCYDSFQYATNPLNTLAEWRNIASEGAMLAITVPQTTNFKRRGLEVQVDSGCYYHYTVSNLIYMLATAGWDCRSGFFKKMPNDPWIQAIVYNSDQPARDPKKTTWYDLLLSNLLPDSASQSISKHGYLVQQELVVPWLDKSLSWLGQK
jgi:SAM-dependent methyltransferase